MEVIVIIAFLVDLFLIYKLYIYNIKYEKCIGLCIKWHFSVHMNVTTFEYTYCDVKYNKTICFTSAFKRPKVGEKYRIYIKKDNPNDIISSWTYNSYIFTFFTTILVYICEL